MTTKRRTLEVTGEGVVLSSPDRCLIRADFNALGESASGALDQVSVLAAAAIDQLKEQGSRPEDLETSNISVTPFFDREKQRVTAHVGKYQLAVKTRSLQDLGAVLGVLADVGGDHFQLQGFQLVHSDQKRLNSEARRQAVADAGARAKDIAESAGLRLGEILHITDGGTGGRVSLIRRGFSHSATSLSDVPIEGGSAETTVRVNVVYEIEG